MKVFTKDNVPSTCGSSGSGYIKATYNQLFKVLGEPTYPTASGDDKVQKEWVVGFKGNVFTIYDWKTFDPEYTMTELDEFNIGGYVSAIEFIEALENKIKELEE
jgi:hypothetical protein